MKTVIVARGATLRGEAPTEPVAIEISGTLPPTSRDATATVNEITAAFDRDAEAIMEALRSVPQGTRHRLMILMLKDREVFFAGR